MKKCIKRFLILTMLFMVVVSCTSPLEKDARNLADIQNRKNKTVRKMLGCKDSLQQLDLLEEIRMLEKQYHSVRQFCAEKYADSADHHAFEEHYKKYLSDKSNN